MIEQMNQRFDSLIRLARHDSPPPIDLADAIMARIASLEVQIASWERQWMWMAGISAVAAAILTVAAIPYWQASSDPLAEVMEAVAWVIQ